MTAASQAPIGMAQALGAEFDALRPGGGYAAAADTAALFAKARDESLALGALCISGGGIRSATFALGAIQGLAEQRVLSRFDYLSTVSGGGYIGSWLTAWSNRVGGVENVLVHLQPGAKAADPHPIGHLRDYNSYLTPKLGALSPDTWTLGAIVFRNLLLNWMVLIPLLMAVLLLPRLFLSALSFPELLHGAVIFANPGVPDYSAPVLNAISASPIVRIALPLLIALLSAAAIFNTLRYLPGIGNEDHGRRDYLTWVLMPLIGAAFAYIAFDSLYYLGDTFALQSSFAAQVLGAIAVGVVAALAYLLAGKGASRSRRLFGPLSLALVAMAAGAGVTLWVATNLLLYSPNPDTNVSWPAYVTLAPPLIVFGCVIGNVIFVGLSSRFLRDDDREWMSSSAAAMLMFCVTWMIVCGVVMVAPTWALNLEKWMAGTVAAAGGFSAWASAFGAAALANRPVPAGATGGMLRRAVSLAIRAAPAVFIAVLALALAIFTDMILTSVQLLPGLDAVPALRVASVDGTPLAWQEHAAILTRSHPLLIAALLALLVAVAWLMARYVNINTFSLHGMYRDRLIRAYLGASNQKRKANKFTGLATDDDIPMHELDPRLKPLHVVNMTLNLVKTSRLAWQQRKAQSFTATALHCGNFELGYRPASGYGGRNGISLGTAVAISGAAASPNMGYHSSPATGFIMTLLNARLGSWLGNPGPAGERTWREASPKSAIASLVSEALGLTSNLNPYVYLSDGGHFENLALYEMVLRRCRSIIVLDSGCDPDFAYEDLGNALRKIRIDLRVPITFADEHIRPLRERRGRCAVATIGYSALGDGTPDGWLIYVKPMCLGTETPDVANYHATCATFPHESTGNQWFNESQTESYRMLGLTSIREICRGWKGGSLDDLRRHVEQVYLGTPCSASASPR
jgi:hypothetical protein